MSNQSEMFGERLMSLLLLNLTKSKVLCHSKNVRSVTILIASTYSFPEIIPENNNAPFEVSND